MSKWFKRVLTVLVPVFLVTVLAGCAEQKPDNVYESTKESKKIVWGVKADTRLFGLMNVKTGNIDGFDIDLAKALTKQMYGKDAKAEFVQTTAKTKVPLLKNGNIDAVAAAMTITDDRKKIINYTQPYFGAGQSLLVKRGSGIKTVKDLNKAGIKVMAVKGTTAVDNVHKFAPKARVLELDDYAQAFTALKSKQGVAMTTDNGILYGVAKENPDYEVVGGTFTNEPYGLAVDKGQDEMSDHLNKALDELKANGTYSKLVKKWFGGIPGFNVKEVEEP
ncbi:transporter substrate-binding domain-containing protein [Ligilactobacillus pobuzihii]|uniref:Glutamine-binding protein n=1 Tax=Ligilactobacillus pobuzihii TaxID=449659 RepID=A0A0R2LJB7_9LACO|nr:transporter substrate-binding domain-containing protein [Ligilactobacillus pobuzihii]KRK09196.1 glutamine-binding protein [Ligilactobacillus pobuzihii E100301 = KCTC 13174]KRN99354.1 glutamine-binding protein [Ligilactobacillus pobuzihii]GEN49134.1 glutamine ABC transporter substrate-binding protein [Ligilactobacillus pobuzihii]